jgi:SAM-dependent methyltransferase
LASLPGLAGVIDPNDTGGGKNRLIDRAQRRILARRLGNMQGSTVIDFGCGTGRLSEWLAARGARVVGLDTSEEMIAEARRRVPNATFEVLDGDRLDLRVTAVDLVLAVGVLKLFVADDDYFARVLTSFKRVLREHGRVLAIEQIGDGSDPERPPLARYRIALERAGFVFDGAEIVRLGFSAALGYAARWSAFSRLPLVPALLEREARMKADQITGAQYADYLIVARTS